MSAAEIKEASYDLSLSRYKERIYREADYDPPEVILGRMKDISDAIADGLAELQELLG